MKPNIIEQRVVTNMVDHQQLRGFVGTFFRGTAGLDSSGAVF